MKQLMGILSMFPTCRSRKLIQLQLSRQHKTRTHPIHSSLVQHSTVVTQNLVLHSSMLWKPPCIHIALHSLCLHPSFGSLLALSFLGAPSLCSNPRETQNHMKSNTCLPCNGFLPEAQNKGLTACQWSSPTAFLGREPFYKAQLFQTWSIGELGSVEGAEHSHLCTKISCCTAGHPTQPAHAFIIRRQHSC